MNYSFLAFGILACCLTANAEEPSAQECLDRAIVTLTKTNQKCIVYSEVATTSSKPEGIKTATKEFIKISSEFKQAPQEFLLIKEGIEDQSGTLGEAPVLVTMLLRQLGETKYGEFIGDSSASLLGTVPDEQKNEDRELTKHRARLPFLVADARHALFLPVYYQRVKEVGVPLVIKSYEGNLVEERQAATDVIGVWQFGVSKVEIRFAKDHSWLPTKLRWFNSKPNQALSRNNVREITDQPTYENEVIWRKVEGVWVPVYVRYTMTQVAAGKARSWECVQHSMYRFKPLETIGPVDGFFEELRNGGPFQKLILEMTDDLLAFQSVEKKRRSLP